MTSPTQPPSSLLPPSGKYFGDHHHSPSVVTSVSCRVSLNWVIADNQNHNHKQQQLLLLYSFLGQNTTMLGYQEPLDCRTDGGFVLDLRTVKDHEDFPPQERRHTDQRRVAWPEPSHESCTALTPPRDASVSPPMMDVMSPTLVITQRVLAAANTQLGGTRPFKAYPKDTLSLSVHNDDYLMFRQQMLNQVRGSKLPQSRKRPASPPSPTQHNLASSSGHDSDDKNAAYWERRRKNNEAAKRSRDARRAKEDEIAVRAAFLEQENLRLKYQVAALTDEAAKLRCLLYKSNEQPV